MESSQKEEGSPSGWSVGTEGLHHEDGGCAEKDSVALRRGHLKTPTAHHRLVRPTVSAELLLTFNPVILAGTPSWVAQP